MRKEKKKKTKITIENNDTREKRCNLHHFKIIYDIKLLNNVIRKLDCVYYTFT